MKVESQGHRCVLWFEHVSTRAWSSFLLPSAIAFGLSERSNATPLRYQAILCTAFAMKNRPLCH